MLCFQQLARQRNFKIFCEQLARFLNELVQLSNRSLVGEILMVSNDEHMMPES